MGMKSKWYESNIKMYERRIPEAASILARLERGERIKHATIGGVLGRHLIYPEAKYVRADLERMKERLAENRKMLKGVI